MNLSIDQEQVLMEIKLWLSDKLQPFWRLSGYAGTGKSFIISYILNNPSFLNLAEHKTIMVCAYTWKAAINLRERGIVNASSIHSLMYKVDPVAEARGELLFIPRKKEEIVMTYSLIIVDESSMVPPKMREDIISYGVPVLFVGDNAQLPSIAKDNNGNDDDFMEHSESRLEKIHRQAEGSPIIELATLIRKGKWRSLEYGKFGNGVFIIDQDDVSDRSLLAADQILCSKNVTRKEINTRIRKLKGYNTKEMPSIDEKLILTNNYVKTGLFNGEQVLFKGVNNNEKLNTLLGNKVSSPYLIKDSIKHIVKIVKEGYDTPIFGKLFFDGISDLPNFVSEMAKFRYMKDNSIFMVDFAYALTVHKSQGSQYKKVIVFEERMGDPKFHTRLLYTAVTRAKDKLILAR